MQALNYSRQIVYQIGKWFKEHGLPPDWRERQIKMGRSYINSPYFNSAGEIIKERQSDLMVQIFQVANYAQKFMLPSGGRLYDDPQYKALEGIDRLALPFPCICLEYERPKFDGEIEPPRFPSGKAAVFVHEGPDTLVMWPMCWVNVMGFWAAMPPLLIPRSNFLADVAGVSGYRAIRAARTDSTLPDGDYSDEIGALMCFLNVLQCSNVGVEVIGGHAKKPKKGKNPLPFDDYHVLVVNSDRTAAARVDLGGTHRSPREHVRRGHIRRLQSGKRVWVNSTIVGAGNGAGKIIKDYQVIE